MPCDAGMRPLQCTAHAVLSKQSGSARRVRWLCCSTAGLDLSKQKVAVFGLGDSLSYGACGTTKLNPMLAFAHSFLKIKASTDGCILDARHVVRLT